jgi:hypothetical protein
MISTVLTIGSFILSTENIVHEVLIVRESESE